MLRAFAIPVLAALTAAQALGQGNTENLRAEPTLIAERPVAAPGETVWIAIEFEIDEGWHTYWPGFNDTGMELDAIIDVSGPAEAGELVWPAPHRYSPTQGMLDHIFEERMTVLLPVSVSTEAEQGERIRVHADMRWLVCERACVLESAEREIEIPVADAAAKPSPETARVFERARERLPRPITDRDAVRIAFDDSRLEIRSNGAAELAFYPSVDGPAPRDLLAEGQAEGETLSIEFRESDRPIEGVLEVWSSPDESKLLAVRWPPEPVKPITPATTDSRVNQ